MTPVKSTLARTQGYESLTASGTSKTQKVAAQVLGLLIFFNSVTRTFAANERQGPSSAESISCVFCLAAFFFFYHLGMQYRRLE